MIVDFDGEGEKWREERLTRVFCSLSEENRIKVRRLVDNEGLLSVFAESPDAIFCAEIQMAWEKQFEALFEVFSMRDWNNLKLRYSNF